MHRRVNVLQYAQEAIRKAKADPRVKAALGEPVQVGALVRGTVHQDETGWGDDPTARP